MGYRAQRSEDLRDIPASIVAISASTIVEAHMTQIDDIGALVSNLFEGQIIRPSDIERIEVLKGPQSTLYGGARAQRYAAPNRGDALNH